MIDHTAQLDEQRLRACSDRMNASSNVPVPMGDVLDAALIALTTLQSQGIEFVRGRRFAALKRSEDGTVTFYTLDSAGALVERGSTTWTGTPE
ncbi:MAG: hypothetical protein QOE25_1571 [Actinomycetota bacterium]|jgi:hypothetical protein|nr:hypothetical protein [Actinomycetota bacterium]